MKIPSFAMVLNVRSVGLKMLRHGWRVVNIIVSSVQFKWNSISVKQNNYKPKMCTQSLDLWIALVCFQCYVFQQFLSRSPLARCVSRSLSPSLCLVDCQTIARLLFFCHSNKFFVLFCSNNIFRAWFVLFVWITRQRLFCIQLLMHDTFWHLLYIQ